MTLSRDVRHLWAEKILELSHIAAGALIFGQFLSERGFSVEMAGFGIAFLVAGYILSLLLLRKK